MLGERLASARKNKGLTQMDLAVALGDRYTQSMISMVEKGHSLLLLDGATKAAEELEVSLDWLVGLSNDPTPPTSREGSPSDGETRSPPGERPALSEFSMKLGQARAYVVSGDSMRPTLTDGSTLLVDGTRKDLQENPHLRVPDRRGTPRPAGDAVAPGRLVVVERQPERAGAPRPARHRGRRGAGRGLMGVPEGGDVGYARFHPAAQPPFRGNRE